MPMKDGIHLEIATAGGSVYDDMVSYVELPFSGGSVGVLKDHAPMLGAIEDGVVTARKEDGTTEFVAVDLGVANIVHNEVTLLVRMAERAENIDLSRAEAAERRAALEAETAQSCEAMRHQAEQESQSYWSEVSRRLEEFYNAHAGLRELLAAGEKKYAGE